MFRVRGIQISLHSTFLLLLAYVGWEGWRDGGGYISALSNIGSILVFFFCVLLHELGHSFTARAFGVRVPRILLMPIGGMAEFASVPKKPAQEILIALAGPAVNFCILLLLALFIPIPSWEKLKEFQLTPLQMLFAMNLIMGCFNLLPAFPMDGGRVLRAILAQFVSYVRATRWAALVGKILAGLGMLGSLFITHNFLTASLFLFIMIAGELEYRAVLRQDRAEQQWKRDDDEIANKSSQPPPLPL